MKPLSVRGILLGLILAAGAPGLHFARAAFAQGGPAGGAPAAVAPGEEVKAVAMAQLKLMGKNIVAIADAMPADKYTWNPGIALDPPPSKAENDDNYGRPFANLLLHIANLNFSRPPLLGAAAAPGYDPKGYETSTTDKVKIVGQLSQAFDYAQNAVQKLTADDLTRRYKAGNQETTGNAIVAQWMENINDYFGQTKAYARVNSVIGTDPGGFGARKLQSAK
jgi:hypothetical protein